MHAFAGAGARGVSGLSLGACRIADVLSFSCLLVYGDARRAGSVMVCVGPVRGQRTTFYLLGRVTNCRGLCLLGGEY